MSRKTIGVVWLVALTMARFHLADAQQPGKVYRIGYLAGGSLARLAPRIEGLRQGLLKLGYVEGQNVEILYRAAEGKVDRLPDLAADLVRQKVDLIVTGGPLPTRAAKETTSTIPIVITNEIDPIGQGFVASLARPGGNITGMTSITADLSAERLELLKETAPRLSRIAVFSNVTDLGNAQALKETEEAARALKLKFSAVEIQSVDDIESAFQTAKRGQPQGLIVLQNPVVLTHFTRMVEFAAKNKLPAMYTNNESVDRGGLMSYGPSITDQYRRAAVYVDKILKGAKPADLPVEQPTKFELIINLKAAKQIGVTIPLRCCIGRTG